MKLQDIGNIPFSMSILKALFPDYKAIAGKAKRLEDSNDIIRLKKGLYVLNPERYRLRLNEFLVANHLYGPSYVSKQSALRFYGLIPERVFEVTSMTIGLTKKYTNKIATFSYTHCTEAYFSTGIRSMEEDEINFLIASPEKALCDLMIYTPNLNLRYLSEMQSFLEHDIRFEMSELKNLDPEIFKEIKSHGKKKTMISKLIELVENERNV